MSRYRYIRRRRLHKLADKSGRDGACGTGDRCASARGIWRSSAAGGACSPGCRSRSAAGAALIVTGPNGAGKSSLLRAHRGFLPLARRGLCAGRRRRRADASASRRIISAMPTAEGRADRRRESRLLRRPCSAAIPRRAARLVGARARSAWPMSIDFPCARCRPARGGASRWRGCSSPSGRSGCSTSRRPRSTPPLKARSRRSCASTCDGGGLIVAATHAPLGLDGAQELRLGADEGAA